MNLLEFPQVPSFNSTLLGDDRPFELGLGPFGSKDLRAVAFRGRERVNDIYSYRVTFSTRIRPQLFNLTTFGVPAVLTIKCKKPRLIQGVSSRLEALGSVPHGGWLYRVDIVPRLWLLRHRRRNRIFQNKTPKEIVEAILREIDILPSECHWRIRNSDYPRLPFVYQRNESDYDFFRRVLASAGIFFFFEHAVDWTGRGSEVLRASEAANMVGGLGLPGGPIGLNALNAVEGIAKLTTVLNFGSEPGHTAKVTDQMAPDILGQAASFGAEQLGGAVGGVVGAASAFASSVLRPDSLRFEDGIGADNHEERVYDFILAKNLRTKSLRLHDRDVERHANWVGSKQKDSVTLPGVHLDVSIDSQGISAGISPDLGAAFDLDSPAIARSVLRQERYQLDASFRSYPRPYHGHNPRTDRELDRLRRDYMEAHGASDCRRMGAGYRFRLANHPNDQVNGEYTITTLESEGFDLAYEPGAKYVYRNRFTCIPSRYAPLPKRRKAPRMGLEVAKVVGIDGTLVMPTIEANECGYVRIRFRWDIQDDKGMPKESLKLNEDNTVYVPIVQPWAGNGYGTQFIPRQGMEVLVGFLEEQGDRPIIVGCVPSLENLPPWAGNEMHRQRVGIRSRSWPAHEGAAWGEGGWSEISIDDQKGGELVYIRAEKDSAEEIVHDKVVHVGNDQGTHVERNKALRVGGNHTVVVEGPQTVTVAGLQHTAVLRDASTTVLGNESTTIQRDRELTVSGDATTRIDGQSAVSVGTVLDCKVGQQCAITVGTHGTEASGSAYVWGDMHVVVAKNLVLKAEETISLQVGGSILEMSKDNIRLVADSMDLSGRQSVTLQSDKVTVSGKSTIETAAPKTTLVSEGAMLKLTGDAQLNGSQVHLNSDVEQISSTSKDGTVKMNQVTLRLLDGHGRPYTDRQYQMQLGPYRFEGTTDGAGMVTQKVPSDAPDGTLTMWLSDYPTGETRTFNVQVTHLAPPNTIQGALARLQHFGYYQGGPVSVMTPKLSEAIKRFQTDNIPYGLKPTGELDAATAALLQQTHGN